MKTITYYRVSTQKQGRSGLGLEAQRAAVDALCRTRGCECLAEYTEIESGRKNDRPELMKALHHAKVTGATLVVAKLDRLSRNAAFLLSLQEAKVKLLFADMPEANEMVIGILAIVAQSEAIATSVRTKEALAAAKARGVKLGNPLGASAFGDSQQKAVERSTASRMDRADNHARNIAPIIDAIRADGHQTYKAIAAELNARGIMTDRQGQWYATTVKNLMARLDNYCGNTSQPVRMAA